MPFAQNKRPGPFRRICGHLHRGVGICAVKRRADLQRRFPHQRRIGDNDHLTLPFQRDAVAVNLYRCGEAVGARLQHDARAIGGPVDDALQGLRRCSRRNQKCRHVLPPR